MIIPLTALEPKLILHNIHAHTWVLCRQLWLTVTSLDVSVHVQRAAVRSLNLNRSHYGHTVKKQNKTQNRHRMHLAVHRSEQNKFWSSAARWWLSWGPARPRPLMIMSGSGNERMDGCNFFLCRRRSTKVAMADGSRCPLTSVASSMCMHTLGDLYQLGVCVHKGGQPQTSHINYTDARKRNLNVNASKFLAASAWMHAHVCECALAVLHSSDVSRLIWFKRMMWLSFFFHTCTLHISTEDNQLRK